MSAEPRSAQQVTDDAGGHAWLIPPSEGFAAEDLDRLRDLPPHTELIDGSLVFASPQKLFHTVAMKFLERALDLLVPADLLVTREMTVTLATRQRPEPDLTVVKISAFVDLEVTSFKPADVVLAIEVVSPESEIRDHERKPQLYAEAGIKHFWLVENEDGKVAVHVYELDAVTRSYLATGIHRGRLQLVAPFLIDIDLTEIEKFGK